MRICHGHVIFVLHLNNRRKLHNFIKYCKSIFIHDVILLFFYLIKIKTKYILKFSSMKNRRNVCKIFHYYDLSISHSFSVYH